MPAPRTPPAAQRAMLVCATLLLGACITMPEGAGELPLEGSWSFNGAVESAHQMLGGPVRFTEDVSGVVEFLPDELNVVGSHGSCRIPRERVRFVGGLTRISCGRMTLVLGPGRGEATIPVQRMRESRSSCAVYRNDDRRGACLDWNTKITTQTVRLTGPISVFSTGDSQTPLR